MKLEGEDQIAVGRSAIGLEPHGLAIAGDRLVNLSLVPQGVAEIDVRLGKIGFSRIASRYAAIASSSCLLSFQGVAEIAVRLGEIRPEPNGLTTGRDRLVKLPGVQSAQRRDC